MNWTKLTHIALISAGLLAAFAGVVYQSSLAGQQVTPTMTFGILAGLVLVMWSRLSTIVRGKLDDESVTTAQKIWHTVIGLAGLAAPLVVFLSSQFTPGSKYFIVGGFLSTFLGDLAKTGELQIFDSFKKISIVVLASTLLLSSPVRAEVTPSTVAPPISFCIGTSYNCVLPDFNLNTVSYDLDAKKWKAGVTSLAVGYMFLFASDQPWASGFALHGAGQWSQGQPSYFAIVPTVVIAKYFEVGMSFAFMDGAIEKNVTLGLSANAELLMQLVTGKTHSARVLEARRLEAAGAAQ